MTDEGPGPPQPLREGYGLRNTRSRLQALHGEDATLSVDPGARAPGAARPPVPRGVVMSVRVLIVDDEPIARRRLRTLLQAESSVEIVGESEDGGSALAAIRRLRPDLVFLDVQMPGLDGFDVIELLSEAEVRRSSS